MIQRRNLDPSLVRTIDMAGLGAAVGDTRYATNSTGATYSWLNGKVQADHLHTSIAAAHTAATEQRNDVILLSPDNHTQTTGLTWSKDLTHLIGMYGNARQNMRSRIGHSANFATLLTVTGWGNTFANLYFMHGRGNATNLNCLTDTGGRNTYQNCHFLPASATELDEANYDLIRLGSNEIYFNDCTFGTDAVAWSAGNMIEFQASTDPPRSFFRNCTFYMNADDNGVTFMKVIAGAGAGIAFFENCKFINIGTTMTLGIDGTGLGNFKMVFDMDCFFYGVTDITAAANEGSIICGVNYAASDATSNLIGTTFDHTG